MLLGRLDRYVLRNVLGAYLASLFFLTFLLVVFETLRNIGKYLQTAGQLQLSSLGLAGMIAEYHLLNLPFVFVNVAPFVTVIACMFAVSRLMTQNEIAPMLFTGRSMLRVLAPAITVALISALGMGLAWELVLSPLVEPRDRLMTLLESGKQTDSVDDLMLRPGETKRQVLYCGKYFRSDQRMEHVKLFDRGLQRGDALLVEAEAARWDAEREDWALEGGTEQKVSRKLPRAYLGAPSVTPDLMFRLGKSAREVNDLSYSELLDLRELKPARRDYVISFHRHLTFPIANLVLLFLALPFAVHFERGRRMERVIAAIAICAIYLVADLTCQNAGYRGWMHPLVSAWAPTIVFGSLSLVFFGGMRT